MNQRSFLLGANEFDLILRGLRILWLGGRLRGGKTSLAFFLAARFRSAGVSDVIVSNIPSPLCDPPEHPLSRASIVLDEAWRFVRGWRNVLAFAAFLGKRDCYLFLPSVWPPHRLMRQFYVFRVLNLYRLGLPVWVYKWELRMGFIRERGRFFWIRPHLTFGLFDTGFEPDDDGGIAAALGFGDDLRSGLGDNDSASFDASSVADAADGMLEAADRLSDGFRRSRSLRRRS